MVGGAVGGISVEFVDPDCVAGNVAVAGTTGVLIGVCSVALAQEVNSKNRSKVSVILFIILFF
jgi:hypothetical protein